MQAANALAEAWGPAVTKLITDKDSSAVEALCADSVELVLGTSSQDVVSLTIGKADSCATVQWNELTELIVQDAQDDYKATESASLGFLGRQMILEAGRINQNDELYVTTTALVTLGSDGKIVKYESFADSMAPSLLDAAMAKQLLVE